MLKIEQPYHFGWKLKANERGIDGLLISDGTHQEIDLDSKASVLDIIIYKEKKEVYWLKKID